MSEPPTGGGAPPVNVDEGESLEEKIDRIAENVEKLSNTVSKIAGLVSKIVAVYRAGEAKREEAEKLEKVRVEAKKTNENLGKNLEELGKIEASISRVEYVFTRMSEVLGGAFRATKSAMRGMMDVFVASMGNFSSAMYATIAKSMEIGMRIAEVAGRTVAAMSIGNGYLAGVAAGVGLIVYQGAMQLILIGKLFGSIKEGIEGLEKLGSLIRRVIGLLSPIVRLMARPFKDALFRAVRILAGLFALERLKTLKGFFSRVASGAGKVAGMVGAGAAGALGAVAGVAGGAVLGALGGAEAVKRIIGLDKVSRGMEYFVEKVKKASDTANNALSSGLYGAAASIASWSRGMVEKGRQVGGVLGDFYIAIGLLVSWAAILANWFGKLVEEVVVFAEKIGNVAAWLESGVVRVAKKIEGVVADVAGVVNRLSSFKNVVDGVVASTEKIVSGIEGALNFAGVKSIVKEVESVLNGLKDAFGGVTSALGVLESAIDDVVGAFKGAVDTLRGVKDKLFGWL